MNAHYVKVKDNFLDESYLKYLQKIMMGHDLPWYSNPITYQDNADDDFQFTHKFFDFYQGPGIYFPCLLYTSPSPRDTERSRMPSSA